VDAVVSLAAGLGWRPAGEPLVVKGEVNDGHTDAARELGGSLAAGLALDLW